MLQVDDIRKTRVYREALEEGREEGREETLKQERQRNLEEKVQSIKMMAHSKIPPEDIARFLKLEVDFVFKELANGST